ncbi:MAG: HesA/MoeB/ThiF family protein [Acidiferrobacteraceae bacterium]
MNDRQLLRYARQILLPEVGIEGQKRLQDACALIIGLGGLGTPSALYLATSGLGRFILVDDDTVDIANLPRQILYDATQTGQPKVACAAAFLQRANEAAHIETINRRLSGNELLAVVRRANVVLDATDNFESRFAINHACVAARVPLVSSAVIRMEGQITVFRRDLPGAPCYRCLYADGVDEDTCVHSGILAPVAGVMGTLQALEAIKILAGIGVDLGGRLLLFDGARTQWREIALRRDPHCPVCGDTASTVP